MGRLRQEVAGSLTPTERLSQRRRTGPAPYPRPGLSFRRLTRQRLIPAHIKQWVTCLVRGVVGAIRALKEAHSRVPRDRAFVAIVLEIDKCGRARVPRRQEFGEQPHCRRCKYPIRPHHLRPVAGCAVAVSFFLKPIIRNQATAAKTRFAWNRDERLVR